MLVIWYIAVALEGSESLVQMDLYYHYEIFQGKILCSISTCRRSKTWQNDM